MDKVDEKKRRFLIQTGSLIGAAGAVGAAIPLVSSMNPKISTKAMAKPIQVNISDLKDGEQKTVIWRGKPVWIIKRNKKTLEALTQLSGMLSDPDSKIDQQPHYAQNKHRSIRPDILVLYGICTHLGCAPTYRPEAGSIDTEWPGGFFCSCHGSKFDLAGRVFKGVPAPTNLEVPPYHFVSQDELIIGEQLKT